MFYSASRKGFFATAIHGANIPTDAVEITAVEHAALMAGQAAGRIIAADTDGRPVLVDPPPPSAEEVRAALHRQIVAERDRRIEALGAGYTPTERETWPMQIADAQALLVDPFAPAPMLRPIATSRGISPVLMAERVMQLASAKAAASGAILAAGRRLADAADAGNLPKDWTDDDHWP